MENMRYWSFDFNKKQFKLFVNIDFDRFKKWDVLKGVKQELIVCFKFKILFIQIKKNLRANTKW